MNAQIVVTAALAAAFCGVLPAKAADSQMLGLVMPDVKIIGGINVDQAKASPFGQYVLAQMAPQDQQLQSLQTLIGFDPRQDVHELLVASTAASGHMGLVMARGMFDPGKIAAAAQLGGAKSEAYNGATILENKEQTAGVAFLDATLAVMGYIPAVKAAIDRQKTPTVLPPALASQVSEWSLSQDAWAVAIVPPSTIQRQPKAPQVPMIGQLAGIQLIQHAAGGVKFGANVVVKVQAETDTAQNATNLVGALQLLANLAQAQSQQNAQTAALWKSMTITAQGALVSLTVSLPETQLEEVVKPHPAAPSVGKAAKKVL